jgi:SAM-dependent methyltransferase
MLDRGARLARRLAQEFLSRIGWPAGRNRHALVGDARLADMKRAFQIAFLRSSGLRPGHTLLDLGCGTLRGGIPIIAYLEQGHYCGIDIRPEVLVEARKELEESGLSDKAPLLLNTSEAAEKLAGRRFDWIWAFSVLIHLSDDILRDTLPFVERHLADAGTFFANVRIGNDPSGHWQGLPVVTRSLPFYQAEADRVGLATRVVGPLRDLGHVSGRAGQDDQIMLAFTRKPRGG